MKNIFHLKDIVIKAAANPNFIHHKWFVKYHLDVVEQIALEACDMYPDANRDHVSALVWIHDYGKILGLTEMKDKIDVIRSILLESGYNKNDITSILEFFKLVESKMEVDLHTAPIEVQIVSSADGASHMVGPFYSLWWYENAEKPFEELMADNKNKAMKDWERKIVLPEIREAFKLRHTYILERSGNFPKRYLT